MSSINNKLAIEIWSGPNYSLINKFLAGENYTIGNRVQTEITYDGKTYSIQRLISVLINLAMPFGEYFLQNHSQYSPKAVFYRGEEQSLLSRFSFNKETFISITYDLDTALSYSSDKFLYRITVDNDVGVFKTGIEYELVLEPRSFWEFKGISTDVVEGVEYTFLDVHISPFRPDFPMYGDSLNELKNKSTTKLVAELEDNNESRSYIGKDVDDAWHSELTGFSVYNAIENNKDDFNSFNESVYTVADFEDEMNLFSIQYDKDDNSENNINELFKYYLSII